MDDVLRINTILYELFINAPLPPYDGPEPDSENLKRLTRLYDEQRLDELTPVEERWMYHRFMPCLTRYGCYPPPKEETPKPTLRLVK